MLVRELIEELLKLDQEREITLFDALKPSCISFEDVKKFYLFAPEHIKACHVADGIILDTTLTSNKTCVLCGKPHYIF